MRATTALKALLSHFFFNFWTDQETDWETDEKTDEEIDEDTDEEASLSDQVFKSIFMTDEVFECSWYHQ